jgi:glycerate kinase
MNILIAPDKFKGSLTAQQVCNAIVEGIRSVDANATLDILPMADGGEGSAQLLTSFSGGTTKTLKVRDPLFRSIESSYGLSRDGKTAFMEMANASGLQLLKSEERDPMKTSSVGTGDLIVDALERGVENIILGIGGSATNDAGIGMATALGVKFYSSSGKHLEPIGANLNAIHAVDSSDLHPQLKNISITIFCDVDNPLHGTRGAAYVFAPQKGADEAMVRELDEGLAHYKKILESSVNCVVDFPGAGAGGGLPASLKAFTSLTVRAGMEYIMEYINLDERIGKADLIITGEGKIDRQTLSGKVVKGIADAAFRHAKPVIAVAGRCDLSAAELAPLRVRKVITLVDSATSEAQAIKNAYSLVRARISSAFREQKIQRLI